MKLSVQKINAIAAFLVAIMTVPAIWDLGKTDPKYAIAALAIVCLAVYALNKIKDPTDFDLDLDDMKVGVRGGKRVTQSAAAVQTTEVSDVGQTEAK